MIGDDIREALIERQKYAEQLWRLNGFPDGEAWALHCLVKNLDPYTGLPESAPPRGSLH